MKLNLKFTFFVIGITLMFFNGISNQVPWDIPEEYINMENPTDATDEEAIIDGKTIYHKECKSCHGKSGLGDGSKADGLEGYLGDFSDPEFFEEQTDGELFYKIKFGRGDMPEFGKKLEYDEDIWLVINYIKTLSE